MKTKLFIFDMGEVLVLDGMNLPSIAEHLNIEPEVLEKDYRKYGYPMIEGFMDTSLYMRHLETEFGLKIEGNIFSSIYSPRTNISLLPVLDAIRRKGVRLVIGSNTFQPHVDVIEKLSENPLGYFDKLYFSHEMGVSKPSLSFFKYILEKENTAGDEAFFVDDREENLKAAEKFGIKTFLYSEERNSSLVEEVERLLSSKL